MSLSEHTTTFNIRSATATDIQNLNWALEVLACELGDKYRANTTILSDACLGPNATCFGLIAQKASITIGAALVSPVFSTTNGSSGIYVSDLWVSASARGSGIGRALLRTSAKIGASKWKSEFVKLTVYADNTDAAQFYDRLGFSRAKRDRTCLLSGVELASLIGDAN